MQLRWVAIVRRKTWKRTKTNNVPSMGPPIMYLIRMEWLWNLHVGKLETNIVGMGVHKIVKHMGKADLKNRMKTITLEKWLTMTPN
jgi:hypothetical protein